MGEVSSARGTFLRAASAMLDQVLAVGAPSRAEEQIRRPPPRLNFLASEQIAAKAKRGIGVAPFRKERKEEGKLCFGSLIYSQRKFTHDPV
jgi:hypothetical protein